MTRLIIFDIHAEIGALDEIIEIRAMPKPTINQRERPETIKNFLVLMFSVVTDRRASSDAEIVELRNQSAYGCISSDPRLMLLSFGIF